MENMWLSRGREEGAGCMGSLGLVDGNDLQLGLINNEVLLCSTGNYIQSLGIDHDEKSYKKGNVYICMTASLCWTAEINTMLEITCISIKKKKKPQSICPYHLQEVSIFWEKILSLPQVGLHDMASKENPKSIFQCCFHR